MIHLLQNKVLVVIKFLNISIIKNCIPMSHWRLTMVDGAQFWISYQQLAFLSIPGRWQLIQNSAQSTIRWRQCDIQIGIGICATLCLILMP